MQYAVLFVFHFVSFIMTGASTFLSKYYGDIGMSPGQIGLLTSVPTLVSLAFMPLIGTWTDRVAHKKYLLAALMACMAAMCFAVGRFRTFFPLIFLVCVYQVFSMSSRPISNTISLEYTDRIHRPYGPVRLLGTVGYQVGALLVGWLLRDSLKGLYPFMGWSVVAALAVAFFLPNIAGHQHASKQKVPMRRLFADRHIATLYVLIFLASITTQFYMAFYSKYMGDIGFTNSQISVITLFSVMAELPFLMFADRIAPKLTVWQWLLVGYVCNGIRWLGLAFARSMWLIVLFQIPGVTVLACFEFFTALYLNHRAAPEQSGLAQMMLSLTIFGAGNIVGSMIGGQIAEFVPTGTIFAFNGVMLLVLAAAQLPVTIRMMREERAEGRSYL